MERLKWSDATSKKGLTESEKGSETDSCVNVSICCNERFGSTN